MNIYSSLLTGKLNKYILSQRPRED